MTYSPNEVPKEASARLQQFLADELDNIAHLVNTLEAASGGGVGELSDLSDVNTSTPTNRNVLVADGVDWESRALVEADISDLGSYAVTGHTHVEADITDLGNYQTALTNTLTLESSTADATLYLKADTSNTVETANPFVRFEQDGNAVAAVVGQVGAANVDAQGNTFTGMVNNGFGIHQLYSSGAICLGINANVALKINSSNDVVVNNDLYADGTIFMPGTGSGRLITTTVAGSMRISNGTQYADIGCRNSSYCHMASSTGAFYFYDDIVMEPNQDVRKASHGNYLYHQSTSYDNDQNGGITFSTGSPSGGTNGDIWFKYT